MRYVSITQQGLDRIPGSKAGDCFPVRKFTSSADGAGEVAHVFDEARNQVWSLGVGGWEPVTTDEETKARLEELRAVIRAESISWGELAELQGLAPHVDPDDVELLEWAGVPEHAE